MGGFKWRDILPDTDSSRTTCSKLLLRLPPELLAHILSFLSGKDIANASRVCRAFHTASQIESVWQKRCLREYAVSLPPAVREFSYRQLYTKLLHKYGYLIGLWQTGISSYGGLLQVKFECGRLLGIEWHPPSNPNLHDPLRRRNLFSIELQQSGQIEVFCQKHQKKSFGAHKCLLKVTNQNSFLSTCCAAESHKHPGGKEEEFLEWLKEENTFVQELEPPLDQLLLMKFLMISGYENSFQHQRLTLPALQPGAVIQPGLFKGTYSAHGLELVMLRYEEHLNRVTVTKITGDPNVPAGQITFKSDLRYPIILTGSQQMNIRELQRQETVASPTPIDRLKPQPFRIPDNCISQDQAVPSACKARFYAFGQIAGHGFTNPSFTGGHWIIFNEDLFGLLWFEILSLSLFHRVQEPIR